MFSKILVAVDGSKAAINALDKAIWLQHQAKGELLLICVYKHHSLFEASLSMVRPQEIQIPDAALSEFAREVVNHAKDYAREKGLAEVRGFVKSGRPSRVIVDFAEEKGADLIVLGSRGMHSKDGMLLGSVAHRVASLAHCPVLVV